MFSLQDICVENIFLSYKDENMLKAEFSELTDHINIFLMQTHEV